MHRARPSGRTIPVPAGGPPAAVWRGRRCLRMRNRCGELAAAGVLPRGLYRDRYVGGRATIHLDNAATTMHKPPQTVIDAVTQAMCLPGAMPGAVPRRVPLMPLVRFTLRCAKLARLWVARGRTMRALRPIPPRRSTPPSMAWCAPATVWSQRCSSTTPCCVRLTALRQSRDR